MLLIQQYFFLILAAYIMQIILQQRSLMFVHSPIIFGPIAYNSHHLKQDYKMMPDLTPLHIELGLILILMVLVKK